MRHDPRGKHKKYKVDHIEISESERTRQGDVPGAGQVASGRFGTQRFTRMKSTGSFLSVGGGVYRRQ